jgi:hypothetical protein
VLPAGPAITLALKQDNVFPGFPKFLKSLQAIEKGFASLPPYQPGFLLQIQPETICDLSLNISIGDINGRPPFVVYVG